MASSFDILLTFLWPSLYQWIRSFGAPSVPKQFSLLQLILKCHLSVKKNEEPSCMMRTLNFKCHKTPHKLTFLLYLCQGLRPVSGGCNCESCVCQTAPQATLSHVKHICSPGEDNMLWLFQKTSYFALTEVEAHRCNESPEICSSLSGTCLGRTFILKVWYLFLVTFCFLYLFCSTCVLFCH